MDSLKLQSHDYDNKASDRKRSVADVYIGTRKQKIKELYQLIYSNKPFIL